MCVFGCANAMKEELQNYQNANIASKHVANNNKRLPNRNQTMKLLLSVFAVFCFVFSFQMPGICSSGTEKLDSMKTQFFGMKTLLLGMRSSKHSKWHILIYQYMQF